MIRKIRFIATLMTAVVIQVSFFPVYFIDLLTPNLTLFFVVHLGIREQFSWSNCLAAFAIGLIQDCFGGLVFGMQGFTYLFIYLLLKQISDRLYADNNLLVSIGVFLAMLLNGLLTLALLMLFSAADGIYSALLGGLLPHALTSTLAALLLVKMVPAPASGRLR